MEFTLNQDLQDYDYALHGFVNTDQIQYDQTGRTLPCRFPPTRE